MVERPWNPYEIQLSCFMVLAVLSDIRECDSLNVEGLALMEFRERIKDDPYGAFLNWNSNHTEPCLWLGVQCIDGKVHNLDLSGFSLRGTLAPGLRKLRYMRSLVLSNNRLLGAIPKEIGELQLLESLDLRFNNLSGTIPDELGGMPSLKCLLLIGNNFHASTHREAERLNLLHECRCDQNLKLGSTMSNDCTYSKSGHRLKKGSYQNLQDGVAEDVAGRRRLLGEGNNLLVAGPPSGVMPLKLQGTQVVSRTGVFPALVSNEPHPLGGNQQPANVPRERDGSMSKRYILLVSSMLIFIFLVLGFFLIPRYTVAKTKQAQEAALLHRLSKVFVTGVPKLESSELQTACEDFSNIIDTYPGCLMYKGILSSGVEIAVVSTSIRSSQQWSDHAENEFKKKVHTLSRINHKNFVNLLGYCEEEDPFLRMMVFEYAPNGNLYEHLHVKDMEHLDWYSRMRIVMGTSYCLEYMHHELNPPVVLQSLQSDSILMSDDYAAKIADISFWGNILGEKEIPDEEQSGVCRGDLASSTEENVFCFGILLLEIVMARSPKREEGSLANWAAQYLSDKEKQSCLVDPTLKSFKKEELEIICEVIQECLADDPSQRPTMQQVTAKLREVTNISPEAATSRFSPLWWAELEILSAETT
ncbi:hypothetical protein Dimus_018832 [Dionaea muscipula]